MKNKLQIKKRIENLVQNSERFNGLVYRVVLEGLVSNFGLEAIIAGRGPKEFQGGRWMAKGVCYVLYSSFSVNIAIQETVRNLKSNKERYIIASLAVNLTKMIDLTNKANLALMKTTIEKLIIPHYSLDSEAESFTQMIGRYAYQAGIEGLKVPSAVSSKEANLVVFSNSTPIEQVQIQDWDIFTT